MKKKIALLKLRPTQMALGMEEVFEKRREYRCLSHKELKKQIKENPIDIVIAPNGWPFIVDGHHRAFALWLLGVKKVHTHVLKDFSRQNMSYDRFWHEMNKHRWTHLYDQFGEGPHDPLYLPPDIRGVGDDPYRSLAWLVQQAGGYQETKDKYLKFRWANFFRQHKLLHHHLEKNFKSAKRKGVELAHSRSAKNLPGYEAA